MKIQFDKTFKDLLEEFQLPQNLDFEIEIPSALKKEISQNVKYYKNVRKDNFDAFPNSSIEDKTYGEDSDNHFHVDWYYHPDVRKSFILGVKTLIELAKRFENENLLNVRLWFSFQTPDMGKAWAIENNLHSEGDEHYISDRLSFYTRRGMDIIEIDNINKSYWGILIIDI